MTETGANQGSAPPRHPGGRPSNAQKAREHLEAGDRIIDILPPTKVRFVREFLVDCNAGAAGKRCGVSRQRGYAMLEDPLIALAIGEEQEDRAERLKITADKVLNELAAIAFSDITDFVDVRRGRIRIKDLADIPPEKRHAIAELVEQRSPGGGHKISFKLHDKMRALRMVADHIGVALQRQILQGDAAGGPIQHQTLPLPPQPKTIQEWEEQVRRAQQMRLPDGGQVDAGPYPDDDDDGAGADGATDAGEGAE